MWGFLDVGGKIFVKPEFLTVASFHAGWARVTMASGKTGFINLRGEFSERQKPVLLDLPTAAGPE